MTVSRLALPTSNTPTKSDFIPITKKFENDDIDPLSLLTSDQLSQIRDQWTKLSENDLVTFEQLEKYFDCEKEQKLRDFKANATRKIERHPSKAVIVTKVLEQSGKTLERRNKLNVGKMRKFLRVIRKKSGSLQKDEEEEFPLDDMSESEFQLVMALRLLEREEAGNSRSPRFAQKSKETLSATKKNLEKLNVYVNTPKTQK